MFEIVFSGGKRSSPSWKIHTGSGKSFTRCSPRSASSRSTSARVACETSTCPPWPAAMIRAARCTSSPTYFGGASQRLTSVQTHPHPNLAQLRPRRPRKCLLTLRRRRDRLLSGCERNKERIALRVDLVPGMPLKRLPKNPPMEVERLQVALRPELLQQPRRPLDVGEQHRHCSSRLLCHQAHYRALTRWGSSVGALAQVSVLGREQFPVPFGDDLDGAVDHFEGGLVVDRIRRA